jgi:transposase-like protein
MPAPHPPEFRQRAVELARQKDQPIAQLAKSLGISESCLRYWLAQADRDEGKREGLPSEERSELAALRRDKRRLEVENEILRRAAAYFRPGECPPKMIYPVVAELAADRIPVAISCRGASMVADAGRPRQPQRRGDHLSGSTRGRRRRVDHPDPRVV